MSLTISVGRPNVMGSSDGCRARNYARTSRIDRAVDANAATAPLSLKRRPTSVARPFSDTSDDRRRRPPHSRRRARQNLQRELGDIVHGDVIRDVIAVTEDCRDTLLANALGEDPPRRDV